LLIFLQKFLLGGCLDNKNVPLALKIINIVKVLTSVSLRKNTQKSQILREKKVEIIKFRQQVPMGHQIG